MALSCNGRAHTQGLADDINIEKDRENYINTDGVILICATAWDITPPRQGLRPGRIVNAIKSKVGPSQLLASSISYSI